MKKTLFTLFSYLRERGINTELAKRECREVHYLTDGKPLLEYQSPDAEDFFDNYNRFYDSIQ